MPARFGQAHTRERSYEQEKALVNFSTLDTLRATICCSILGERIKTVEELSGNEIVSREHEREMSSADDCIAPSVLVTTKCVPRACGMKEGDFYEYRCIERQPA